MTVSTINRREMTDRQIAQRKLGGQEIDEAGLAYRSFEEKRARIRKIFEGELEK